MSLRREGILPGMRVPPSRSAIAAAITLTVAGITQAAAQVAAPAPAPTRLGARGQTLVTSELALDYQRDTVTVDGEDVTTTRFDFHAGFDRVLAARLTLGLRVGFAGELSGYDTRRGFDVGLRFGHLLPVGGSTTWWPSLGFEYGLTTVADRSSSATIRTVTLVASAPFLWQPAHHALVGVGPTYSRDLQSKTGPDADQTGPKVAGFGIHGFLGLWF